MRLRGADMEKLKVRKPDWVWLNSVTIVFFFNRLYPENNKLLQGIIEGVSMGLTNRRKTAKNLVEKIDKF